MRKRIVTMICLVFLSLCLSACGGNQDADKSSSETESASGIAQSLETHESGVIEVPENAEGQLR